jgi:hypothetical protein
MTACQREILHRMRVAQAALALTDRRVAEAIGISVKSYQAGNLCTGAARRFAKAFDVSIFWLMLGEGAEIKPHLSRAKGKVVILPVHGPKNRLWQERDREMNQKLWRLAQDTAAQFGRQKAREIFAAHHAPPDDRSP